MNDDKFIEKIEEVLGRNQLRDLKISNYKSENKVKTFSYEGKTYSIIQPSPLSNMILYKLRKNAEERWNDGFSVIKYDEDPITHSIVMHEKLQEKLNLPKLMNDKIKDTYLENKLIITKLPAEKTDAVKYSKKNPKALARYIGEGLSLMHNEDIAYRDPSIYTLDVFERRGYLSFNNLAFAQTIEKTEDKARDVMQFLISIQYNSKTPIEDLTQIFATYYKTNSKSKNGMRSAMEKVIEYDMGHRSFNLKKQIYQWTVFGVGQDKMIDLKKKILENYPI